MEDDSEIIGIPLVESFKHLTGACTLRSPEVDKFANSQQGLWRSFGVALLSS